MRPWRGSLERFVENKSLIKRIWWMATRFKFK